MIHTVQGVWDHMTSTNWPADHCFKKIKVFTGPSIETFQELKLQSIEGNLNITLEVGIMTEALGDAVFYFYVFLEL